MTSGKQKETFREREANEWFRRNRPSLGSAISDPLITVLANKISPPKRVLEIGCANGWRLDALSKIWKDTELYGVDPSKDAIDHGASFFKIRLSVGTADALNFKDAQFDLVIFGFCLYLVDRSDLFKIVAESDRVLCENGHLAIFDFYSPRSYSRPYIHSPGIFSYKMDYSKLWTGNPGYTLQTQSFFDHDQTNVAPLELEKISNPENAVSVSILHKDIKQCWDPTKSPTS